MRPTTKIPTKKRLSPKTHHVSTYINIKACSLYHNDEFSIKQKGKISSSNTKHKSVLVAKSFGVPLFSKLCCIYLSARDRNFERRENERGKEGWREREEGRGGAEGTKA